MKHLENNARNSVYDMEALKGSLELERVPEAVERRLRQVYAELPDELPRRKTGPAKLLKGLAATAAGLAAAFVVLLGVSAVNPAFAEELPLVGVLFRQYNQGKKTAVGTYIGTFDGISQINSQADGKNAEGLTLTAKEAYSDGEYIHLSFTMTAPEEYQERYEYLSLKTEVKVNGQALDPYWVSLEPAGDRFEGTLSLRLDIPAKNGETLSLIYETTEFMGIGKDYTTQEALSGAFSGSFSLTADTSHNQVIEGFGGSGDIRIEKVEASPSHTKITYEIPFWGVSTYTMDFPRLYTMDGTPIRGTVGESETVSPSSIPADAETITGTHFFDGLPNGTKQVILRFMEVDTADGMTFRTANGEERQAGVLGEVTIDLATGEAVPSETYKDAGLSYAADYRENFFELQWHAGFDDIQHREGYPRQMDLFDAEDLFQNGMTLESVGYTKGDSLTLDFLSTELLEKDLKLTVTGEDGKALAAGIIAKNSVTDNQSMLGYSTEEEMLAAQEKYLREEVYGGYEEDNEEMINKMDEEIAALPEYYLKTEPGKYYFRAVLDLLPGRELKVLDHATVILSDPDTGEKLYERTVRFVRYRYW